MIRLLTFWILFYRFLFWFMTLWLVPIPTIPRKDSPGQDTPTQLPLTVSSPIPFVRVYLIPEFVLPWPSRFLWELAVVHHCRREMQEHALASWEAARTSPSSSVLFDNSIQHPSHHCHVPSHNSSFKALEVGRKPESVFLCYPLRQIEKGSPGHFKLFDSSATTAPYEMLTSEFLKYYAASRFACPIESWLGLLISPASLQRLTTDAAVCLSLCSLGDNFSSHNIKIRIWNVKNLKLPPNLLLLKVFIKC